MGILKSFSPNNSLKIRSQITKKNYGNLRFIIETLMASSLNRKEQSVLHRGRLYNRFLKDFFKALQLERSRIEASFNVILVLTRQIERTPYHRKYTNSLQALFG